MPSPTPSSRGVGDFWASLVSVQQENGRILLYITILGVLNFGLAMAISRMPGPDTYLVDGVKQVSSTPIYWNQSNEAIQALLSDFPSLLPADAPGGRVPPPRGPIAPEK
jgi:hypothetical protein